MTDFPRIELTPDDNGTFLVTSPDLPELTTYGETEDEAERMAALAVDEALAARASRRNDPWAPVRLKTARDLVAEGIVPCCEDFLRTLARRHGVGRMLGRTYVFTPQDIIALIEQLPRPGEAPERPDAGLHLKELAMTGKGAKRRPATRRGSPRGAAKGK